MLHRVVFHNDRLITIDQARLSPGQGGLLSGWGLFTTMRVHEGIPFAFERHWQRLQRDAERTHVPFPFDEETVRRNLGEIQRLAESGLECRVVEVKDRFGDYGLVGVMISSERGEALEIDTFLLSCRVIGRSVETGLVSYIAQSARARGRKRLAGRFLPTKKNTPAAEFYAQSGFQRQPPDDEGQRWIFNLEEGQIRCPEWIRLNVLEGGRV